MANPQVRVDLTARDMASSALDRLNKKLEQIQAPAKRSQAALDRFARNTGLSHVSEGFDRVGRSASSAFRSVGEIIPVLGTLTGAASVAGIYRLSTAWANFGSGLGFSARRLGVSSQQLMTLGGAARLAGSSADALQSGMQHLGQGMWDAVGGRNPEMVAAFAAYHIGLNQLDTSAGGVAKMMPILNERIRAIHNPIAQLAVATAFYGSAASDLLPVINGGARSFREYQQEAVRYGVMNARGVQAANDLRVAQTRLSLAVEGFGWSVAEKVEPALAPVVTGMANWIAANRGWIATDIGRYVGEFASYIEHIDWRSVEKGAEGVWGEIRTAVHWLDSWKNAAKGTPWGALAVGAAGAALLGRGALGAAGRLASSPIGMGLGADAAVWSWAASRGAGEVPKAAWGTLSARMGLNRLDDNLRIDVGRHQGNLTQRQRATVARDDIADFMRRGWTRPQANIIEGNLTQESGLNPYKINTASGAYGLAQWLDPSRIARFRQVEKVAPVYATRAQQRDFIDWELHHTYAGSGRLLRGMNDERQAAVFGKSYEGYGAKEEGNRTRYAMGYAGLDLSAASEQPTASRATLVSYNASAAMPEPTPLTAGPPVTVPPGSAQTGPLEDALARFRLSVAVEHKNAPAGSKVRVESSDSRVRVASVDTQRAMDPLNSTKGY